jgi:hypothetical protein
MGREIRVRLNAEFFENWLESQGWIKLEFPLFPGFKVKSATWSEEDRRLDLLMEHPELEALDEVLEPHIRLRTASAREIYDEQVHGEQERFRVAPEETS